MDNKVTKLVMTSFDKQSLEPKYWKTFCWTSDTINKIKKEYNYPIVLAYVVTKTNQHFN